MQFITLQIHRIKNIAPRLLIAVRVLVMIADQNPVRIFIGDSHNNFINQIQNKKKNRWNFNKKRELVLWMGPKLMHTIGDRGFPFTLLELTALRLLNVSHIYFNFGEIDVRVHGGKLGDNQSIDRLVTNYVSYIENFTSNIKVKKVYFINIIPPSDLGIQNPEFPRNETLEFRIELTKAINSCLLTHIGENKVVDQHSVLADSKGSLNFIYSHDGLHVNSIGAKRVLKLIQ